MTGLILFKEAGNPAQGQYTITGYYKFGILFRWVVSEMVYSFVLFKENARGVTDSIRGHCLEFVTRVVWQALESVVSKTRYNMPAWS